MDNRHAETTNISYSPNKLSQNELNAIIQEYSPEAFLNKWCLELIGKTLFTKSVFPINCNICSRWVLYAQFL